MGLGVGGPHKAARHLQNTPRTRPLLAASGSQSALYRAPISACNVARVCLHEPRVCSSLSLVLVVVCLFARCSLVLACPLAYCARCEVEDSSNHDKIEAQAVRLRVGSCMGAARGGSSRAAVNTYTSLCALCVVCCPVLWCVLPVCSSLGAGHRHSTQAPPATRPP